MERNKQATAVGRGPSVRRWGLLAAALISGWAALWLVRPDAGNLSGTESPRERPGAAAMDLGGVYLCPLDFQYAAYASGEHYYPPNHPLVPDPNVKPEGCFGSPGDAEASGYTLALPPYASQVVDGIYLEFMPKLERQCLRAANRLGFRVPCPTLLPNPGPGSTPPRCGDPTSFGIYTGPPCVYAGAFFVLDQAGFAVPPGYPTNAFGGPRLMLVAFRPRDARRGFEVRYQLACPDGEPLGTTSVLPQNGAQPLPATFVRCPILMPPPLAQHVILQWRQDAILYEVAVQSDTPANRRLLEAIASSVQIIGPPG